MWGVLLGLLTSSAVAQDDERAKQFEKLAHDVAHLEQQGNVLKQVVRLVRPNVVHIEAEKTDPLAKRYSHHSIEEAGSGTIIQLGTRFYVLTNRHVIKAATDNNIHIKLQDGRADHSDAGLVRPRNRRRHHGSRCAASRSSAHRR